MGSKAIKMKDISGNAIYPCPYYPVGSIYMSVNNINPSTFFGGKWEQIKDRFLLACGSTYSNGSTGGNTTHVHSTGDFTLTMKHIPLYDLWLSNGNYGAKVNSFINDGVNYGVSTWNSQQTSPHNHGNTGSSNNMPPYLAVYVWKRIA